MSQRTNAAQKVEIGDVTGNANLTLIGYGADNLDAMNTGDIGTEEQCFGNVDIYGSKVSTGDILLAR